MTPVSIYSLPRHWLAAAGLALAAHSALFVSIDWRPEATGARAEGMLGIEVSLAPVAAAYSEPQPTPPPEPAQPQPEPAPEPEPPAKAIPVALKKVQPQEPPPETLVEPQPEPPPPPEPEREDSSTAHTEAAPGEPAAAELTDDTPASGGMSGEVVDYITRLQAWLEKHKRYPRRAQQRRQQGIVELYVRLARDGEVLEHRFARSSGFRLLDEEVGRLLKKAQPLPGIPDDYGGDSMELIIPIEFFLR